MQVVCNQMHCYGIFYDLIIIHLTGSDYLFTRSLNHQIMIMNIIINKITMKLIRSSYTFLFEFFLICHLDYLDCIGLPLTVSLPLDIGHQISHGLPPDIGLHQIILRGNIIIGHLITLGNQIIPGHHIIFFFDAALTLGIILGQCITLNKCVWSMYQIIGLFSNLRLCLNIKMGSG